MSRRFALPVIGVLAMVFAATGAMGALPSKCSSTKTKAAGKKAGSKLTCLSKGVAKGIFPTDSTCLAKAEVKFSKDVAKAEAKNPAECLSTGDATNLEGKIDSLVDDIDALVAPAAPPGKACDAAKVKAAGKKASTKLGCHAKAIGKGLPTTDSTCLAKAEVKFSSAVAKAEAKSAGADCSDTLDGANYEQLIDAAVTDVVAEINPTTSTTSTTASTTTTVSSSTTTTTMGGPQCAPILTGQPITSTYNMLGILGPTLCQTNSSANKFGPCTTDANCGGTSGGCVQTPWITAGGITLTFPTNVSATFNVTQGTFPTCSHTACMVCGDPNQPCGSIPGCVGDPSCTKTTCCDQPHFTVPSFSIPTLAVCVNVDQAACGVGVFNTSSPQMGDNEVDKRGDTSDPGADCTYGTGDDVPASPAHPCNSAGQGADTKGKITRVIGNGAVDAAGTQYRLLAPLLATAWSGDVEGCPTNAVFDGINVGELILTQINLNAELATAGVTARFQDMNGDGCALAGAGFSGAGPVTVGPPALVPMPAGGGPSRTGAAGIALGGSGPLFDTGFVGIIPFATPTIAAPEACSCTVVPGCPE